MRILNGLISATALFAVCSTAPAFASSNDIGQHVGEGPEFQGKATFDAKTGKVCITQPAATGSHIPETACKTPEEWAKLGLTFKTKAS